MKIKLFKKESKLIKEPENLWLKINFYWKLAVCFMLVATILSMFFGYYFFIQVNSEGDTDATEAGSQIHTIKKDRIDKVLEYFSARKQKSSQIISSPAPVIDPSL